MQRVKDRARGLHQSARVSPHNNVVDVRDVPLWRRLPSILAAFDALAPGDAMELVVDLDPWPLHNYFDGARGGMCVWRALESGPPVWRVRLERQP